MSVKTPKDLEKIRESAQKDLKIRGGAAGTRIVVGMGTCGIAAGAREVMASILDEISRRELADVAVTQTGCIGLCEYEPLVEVIKAGQQKVTYCRVDANKARQIIARHVVNDQVIDDWVLKTG